MTRLLLIYEEPSPPRGGVLKCDVSVTCVACRVMVLGSDGALVEDLYLCSLFVSLPINILSIS
jgi:hypothetical protein